MGRRTVWIPEELEQLAEHELPAVNWSAALQAGIRALLECEHGELSCTACGATRTREAIVGPPLEELYTRTMWELGLKRDQPGYVGAASIVRRVAIDAGVPGIATVPIPRTTKATATARADEAFLATQATRLPLEADSRRRHPTARPVPIDHPGPQQAQPTQETSMSITQFTTQPMTREQAQELNHHIGEMATEDGWPIGAGIETVLSGHQVVGFVIYADYPDTLSELVFRLADAGHALLASQVAWAVSKTRYGRGGRFTDQPLNAAEDAIDYMEQLRAERAAAAPAETGQIELFGTDS